MKIQEFAKHLDEPREIGKKKQKVSSSDMKKLKNKAFEMYREMLNQPNYIRNVAPVPANQEDGEHKYYNPDVKESSTSFKPEKRRKLKPGEIEIMKGRGNRQTWFYVKNKNDAKTLIRLGRNYAFPTGITKNNSREKFDKGFFIKESINEANPEAMVGKKLGALLKSLDRTVAQYKKKANVKSHMNFFEAGVKSVMRKHGIK